MASATIDTVRRFNRFYTRKIGVLSESLLDSPFSLTEGRVLYEVAHRPGVIATDLGRDLGLDAGYLSRILVRFAKKNLIERTRSKRDGRQSHLRLSAAGREAFAELNARSSAQIARLIGHLPDAGQEHLATLLSGATHLLADPSEVSGKIVLRDPQPGDLGWVVQRHGALYAAEYDWDETFEALVAKIVADYVAHRDPQRERIWMAEMDHHLVGCIFLIRDSDSVAKLRLLLVEPTARGHGIGRKLVAECVAFARKAGYKKITLWTNSVLHAARHLYEHAGFRLAKSEPHRSFGHDLIGQYWELDL